VSDDRVPALAVRSASKRFGAVLALDQVDVEVHHGEVLAVLGDNGAGKSTLIKCISGVHRLDEGTVEVDGIPVTMTSPALARAAGIETVYQDLALAPNRDVVQNIYLGRELCYGGVLRPFGILNAPEMRRIAEQHLKQLEVGLPRIVGLPIGQMSGGQRQCVAVARSAFWSSKVLFMDEPTAALGVRESEAVLRLIRRVAHTGTAVALISHAIPHVVALADRVVVLRHGRNVADLRGHLTVEEVVNLIVGSAGHSGAR
jgi:D-xylose transport system ATP-binding protein